MGLGESKALIAGIGCYLQLVPRFRMLYLMISMMGIVEMLWVLTGTSILIMQMMANPLLVV